MEKQTDQRFFRQFYSYTINSSSSSTSYIDSASGGELPLSLLATPSLTLHFLLSLSFTLTSLFNWETVHSYCRHLSQLFSVLLLPSTLLSLTVKRFSLSFHCRANFFIHSFPSTSSPCTGLSSSLDLLPLQPLLTSTKHLNLLFSTFHSHSQHFSPSSIHSFLAVQAALAFYLHRHPLPSNSALSQGCLVRLYAAHPQLEQLSLCSTVV